MVALATSFWESFLIPTFLARFAHHIWELFYFFFRIPGYLPDGFSQNKSLCVVRKEALVIVMYRLFQKENKVRILKIFKQNIIVFMLKHFY